MNINEARKIQKNKTTLITVIPKIIACFLGIKKGDKIVFKNENEKIYIEKNKDDN